MFQFFKNVFLMSDSVSLLCPHQSGILAFDGEAFFDWRLRNY